MDVGAKTVWITGASSGIGEALARAFSRKNCKIILSGRDTARLQQLANELGAAQCRILPFDLSDSSLDRSALVSQAWNFFGGIHIFVNNGGVSQRSPALETSVPLLRKLMETDFFSHAELSSITAARMISSGGGKLVVISSIAGKFGFYERSAYSAAKHALHGYFESLRLENESKGLSVLMVCPGKIRTNISVRALLPDGTASGKMEPSHMKAMSADRCAEKILSAIRSNKEEIYVGGKELLMPFFKQWMPPLFRFLLRRVKKD